MKVSKAPDHTQNTFEDVRNRYSNDNEFELMIERIDQVDHKNSWF